MFDSVGKDTFLRSLDCLRLRGTMVTFGQASGPIDPIAPVLLSQKGSLFLTRPFLFQYIDKRHELEAAANDLFAMVVAAAGIPIDTRSGVVHVAFPPSSSSRFIVIFSC